MLCHWPSWCPLSRRHPWLLEEPQTIEDADPPFDAPFVSPAVAWKTSPLLTACTPEEMHASAASFSPSAAEDGSRDVRVELHLAEATAAPPLSSESLPPSPTTPPV